MEGNFYVVDIPLKTDAKGKLAAAYRQCADESSVYGKCVELAHANKTLQRNSCVQERLALRQCIDKHVEKNRGAEWVERRDAPASAGAAAAATESKDK
jgi:hypothetical protein